MSVRPSVKRRYSVETAKHILKPFLCSSSHTILVLPQQTIWQYSDDDFLLIYDFLLILILMLMLMSTGININVNIY